MLKEKLVERIQKNIHKIWDLLELFFQTKQAYLDIYRHYEREVIQHAKNKGVNRTKLRLDQEEVSELFDFAKVLELRNVYLFSLKELSHRIFRSSNQTDPFDRWVNSIFYEISILKEEHYKVKNIAPEYVVENETEESDLILDEVHESFPRIMGHVNSLFQKATIRLEQMLPLFNQEKIFIRSAYLFAENLLSKEYKGGIEDFYIKMYPEYGAFEAYLFVAQSFQNSGFYDLARESSGKGKSYLTVFEKKKTNSPKFKELLAQYSQLNYRCNQEK